MEFLKDLICKLFNIKRCKCPQTVIDRLHEDMNHCVVNDCTHDWGGK